MDYNKKMILDFVKSIDTSYLHFSSSDNHDRVISTPSDSLVNDIKNLSSIKTISDRVLKIIRMCAKYITVTDNNVYQCRAGANRSSADIWRIYNYYFGPVSLFYILRILYKLVTNHDIGMLYCYDIHKLVFYDDDCHDDDAKFCDNELGVPLSEWETIGIK